MAYTITELETPPVLSYERIKNGGASPTLPKRIKHPFDASTVLPTSAEKMRLRRANLVDGFHNKF